MDLTCYRIKYVKIKKNSKYLIVISKNYLRIDMVRTDSQEQIKKGDNE